MKFCRSTHLLMCLSLESLMSIIKTDSPILVEMIDLVNSVIIFLPQMTLLRCLTFLLWSLTVILTVLLFWFYFRQGSNCCKRILEAAKLAYAIQQKNPSLPRNLVLGTFGKLLTVFPTKVNLLYLLYSTACRCCLLLLIKQNCFLKFFLRTLILMTQVSLSLFSLLQE